MTKAARSAALVPYIRQSVEKEVTISLSEQRTKIEAWAKSNGVDLLDPITDEGVSSGEPWRKRGLAKILEQVKAGKAAGVIVAYSSRLSRESLSAQHEIAEEFVGAGGRLVAVDRGIDTAVAGWEYLFSMDAIEKKNHLAEIGSRWADARRACVERGVHFSQQVPTGYDRPRIQATNKNGEPAADRDGNPIMTSAPLVPNADAPAVRELFRRRSTGATWGELMIVFQEAGVRNHAGSTKWSVRALKRMLQNPVYLGTAYSGDFRKENAHPAIVDEPLFRKVQTTLTRGEQCKRIAPQSLLSGMLYCRSCGRRMTPVAGTPATGQKARYNCRSNRVANVECLAPASCIAEEMDDLVEKAFVHLVPAFYENEPHIDLEPLERALAEARTRKTKLQERLIALDDFDPEDAREKLAAAKAEVEAAEDALTQAREVGGDGLLARTVGAQWQDGELTVEEKRRWLREFGFTFDVERGPRNSALVKRARLTWKGTPVPANPEDVRFQTVEDLAREWDAIEVEEAA